MPLAVKAPMVIWLGHKKAALNVELKIFMQHIESL